MQQCTACSLPCKATYTQEVPVSLMTEGRRSKYFWPASAITPADMALLHAARESTQPRVPISELIARAIRQTYGQATIVPLPAPEPQPRNERNAA